MVVSLRPGPRGRSLSLSLSLALSLALGAGPARADEDVAEGSKEGEALSPFGYVEGFYQWNLGNPANDITDFRGFDNRASSFTLSNVAVGADHRKGVLVGRIVFQVGHTPSTYYLAEPERPGGQATSATGTELWKYLQEAHAGVRLGPEGRLRVEAGLFLSPIGIETIAVHENWNFSRSNLFFGLPFYHAGVRASYELAGGWEAMLAVFNGWNSVVDNNREKSVAAQVTRSTAALDLSFLYFGGVERDRGVPEGRPWRHLVDLHATWRVARRLAFAAHGNVGLEQNAFGTSGWLAGAAYGRLEAAENLFVALRGDAFRERAASSAEGAAGRIFWPVDWVASGTVTFDYRPAPRMSVRLEARHDRAAGDIFFGSDAAGDGIVTPWMPDRSTQTTVTIGASWWF